MDNLDSLYSADFRQTRLTREGTPFQTFFETFDPKNHELRVMQERNDCWYTYEVVSGLPEGLGPLIFKVYHHHKFKVPLSERIGGYFRIPDAKHAFKIGDYLSKHNTSLSPKTYAYTKVKKKGRYHASYLFQEFLPNAQSTDDYIRTCQKKDKIKIIRQLAKVFVALHKESICHFDPGFNNIIVQNHRPYIIDYDDAVRLPKGVRFLGFLCVVFDLNILLLAFQQKFPKWDRYRFYSAYAKQSSWSKRKLGIMSLFINKAYFPKT
ncbi:hypothetical protein DID77_00125 [Candidatus Marinamargulisbacteria bacterium SCGC AG-439-L15]|nr:hypothetical protein DID77_00125 [Candidatus Marinamargulisbacteria bacterium SCGC AG-439-L15]